MPVPDRHMVMRPSLVTSPSLSTMVILPPTPVDTPVKAKPRLVRLLLWSTARSPPTVVRGVVFEVQIAADRGKDREGRGQVRKVRLRDCDAACDSSEVQKCRAVGDAANDEVAVYLTECQSEVEPRSRAELRR